MAVLIADLEQLLDSDFIRLESSLEAEISVNILPLYSLCIGEKKRG